PPLEAQLEIVRVNEVADVLLDRLDARVARHRAEVLVYEADLAADGGVHDPDRGLLERRSVARLACSERGLGLLAARDVEQRAEPALPVARPRFPLHWFVDLLDLDPGAVGVPDAVFHLDAKPGAARLDHLGANVRPVLDMDELEPFARAARHRGVRDAEQARQRLRPALDRAVLAGDDVREPGHGLRAPERGLAFRQRALRLPNGGRALRVLQRPLHRDGQPHQVGLQNVVRRAIFQRADRIFLTD